MLSVLQGFPWHSHYHDEVDLESAVATSDQHLARDQSGKIKFVEKKCSLKYFREIHLCFDIFSVPPACRLNKQCQVNAPMDIKMIINFMS